MARIVALIILLASFAQAQEWRGYVPQKQRKDIFKKCAKTGGTGLALSGQAVIAIWVTEPMARVLVSEAIDKERLTDDAAELKYKSLRPENAYCFLITAYRFGIGAALIQGKSVENPLAGNETFLQRADDRKVFSRAVIDDHQFDVNLGGFIQPGNIQSTYRVLFTKSADVPIVREMKDKIEIQFSLSGKKVVLDYKIKEMVKDLGEL